MKFKIILGASLLLATVSAVHAQEVKGAKELFFGTDGEIRTVEASAGSRTAPTAVVVPTSAPATSVKTKPANATRVAHAIPTRTATASPVHLGLRTSIKLLAADGSTRTVSPNTKFKSGEVFQLALQSNKTGYLYVVNIGSTGKETVMYPAKATDNNLILAFQDYIIPARMRFDTNAGVEQLIVALSPTPTNSIQTRVQGMKLVTISTQPGSRTNGASGSNRVAAAESLSAVAPLATAQAAEVPNERGNNELANATPSVVLADNSGSRDLALDDSDGVLTVVGSTAPVSSNYAAMAPLVVNIKLAHE